MARNADTRFDALALPLALLLALAQGGSCRGGAVTNAANTPNTSNTPAGATAAPPVNRTTAAGNSAAVAAKGDTAVNRMNEAAGGGEDVAVGTWGGEHVRLEVSGDGAEVEFDCAHGRIDGRLRPGADGRFDAAGTFVPERGGPVRVGEREAEQPARYSGRVSGKTMTLNVRLTDSNIDAGTFTLTHGREAELTKCR